MSFSFSRLMSVGTASYAVYALVKPRHLGAVLSDDPGRQASYDLVATTYGCRDLAVSAVGVLGRSPQTVRAAMLIRVAMDLADAAVLTQRAETSVGRKKVAAATLSWAALNSLAVAIDRRHD
ncbi:MAG: hypothetical protein ACRDO7_03795 [Nocardioidaceae bacterium]